MKIDLVNFNKQYKNILPEIKEEFNKIFENHNYILGKQVIDFENEIQEYLAVNHAIGCASGSDALVLALKALEIGKGDEVITTPFTFFATAGSISRVGAKPIFCDINPKTFNIDPKKIEDKITKYTKAIMPVHLFGQPADMISIMEIAKKHNLKVIEDNAQGIGAKINEKFAGTIGDIGTLSFFPTKNLGCMGDGGMCLTNDDEIAERLNILRKHGGKTKYHHDFIGLNSRLDTLQAAVLSKKLPFLEEWSESRRKNAEYYSENLKDIPEIQIPFIVKEAITIYNQFSLIAEKRDELQNFLKKKNIGCAIYYPKPLHLQNCFKDLGHKLGDFPITEKISKKIISIPIFPELNKEEKDYIINTIKEFYKK